MLNLLNRFCLFSVEKAVLLFELFPDIILFILFFLVLFFILSLFVFVFKFESFLLLLLLLLFVMEFANILCVTVIFGLFVLAKDLIDLLMAIKESLFEFFWFLEVLIFSFLFLFSELLLFVFE